MQGQALLRKWRLDKNSNFSYKLWIHNANDKAAQKKRADNSQMSIWGKHFDTNETIIIKLNSSRP